MKVKAKFYSETVRHSGACPICGRRVDPKRHWENSLYSYTLHGKRYYVPVHDWCAGVKKTNKIRGGRVAAYAPDIEIEVEE